MTAAGGTSRTNSLRAFMVQPAVAVVAGALVLSALSLLYPSTPTYDPWAWIVWGREIVHLDLQTTGGPSWKPLPMFFTVPFGIFGGIAPDLWLIVARAGTLISLVLAFVLAGRFCEATWGAGDSPRRGWVATIAGLVGAATVLLQVGYIRYAAMGDSEGLCNAVAFAAILWHIDGKRKGALLFATAAALLRPEVWPFLGLYGLWLWFSNPELRRWLVGCAAALPVLWFLPEYIGSGDFLRAASRAKQPNEYSPAFADNPFLETINQGKPIIPVVLHPIVELSLPFLAWSAWRRRWLPVVMFVGAGLWIVLVAAMTQGGFAGNPRYMMLGTSLLAILGGYAVGSLMVVVRKAAGAVDARLIVPASVIFTLAIPVAAWSKGLNERLHQYSNLNRVLHKEAKRRDTLPAAINLAGGRTKVLACGEVSTERFQVPLVAWYLNTHTLRVGAPVGDERTPSPGTDFETASPGNPPAPKYRPAGSKELGTVGPWKVFQACSGNVTK